MQDPNLVNRPPEDRATRPVETPGPTVVNRTGGGMGGWAVAAIVVVIIAAGLFYFAGGGTPGVDPNANTSSIGAEDTAPAGGQTDVQPTQNQPAQGGGATTTTP